MNCRFTLPLEFAVLCFGLGTWVAGCGSDNKGNNGASVGGAPPSSSATEQQSGNGGSDGDDQQSTSTSSAGGNPSSKGGSGGKSQGSTSSTGSSRGGSSSASGGQGTTATGTAVGVGGESCVAAPEEAGFDEVPPSDPNIRYVGRVYHTAKAAQFAFPAVQIQTVFEGDAIDMRLRDHGLGKVDSTNYYWVIVDGVATKLQVCEVREVYPLARDLGPGPHSLTIVKRTESGPGGQSGAGKGEFLGFRVRTGTSLSKATAPTRRMEFVGDSITCGYGNEVSIDDPSASPFTSVNEDAWNAYGAVTARAFQADYVAVAASGRGVIRNYGGFTGDVVPVLYDRTLPEQKSAPAWDHSTYSPDVIVVNLGTNDYSPGIELDQFEAHRAAFKQGYSDFLTHIREVHPEATIICAVGPMMNDDFPEGYNAWTSIRADVKAVVDARLSAADTKTYYFEFEPHSAPYGEDYHPTLATHQAMADSLGTFVSDVVGWSR